MNNTISGFCIGLTLPLWGIYMFALIKLIME